MTKIYPAKVSYALLSVIFLVSYGPLVLFFREYEPDKKIMMTIVGVTLVFIFILHLFF